MSKGTLEPLMGKTIHSSRDDDRSITENKKASILRDTIVCTYTSPGKYLKYDLHRSLRIREIEGTRTKRNAMRIFKCKHRRSMFLLSRASVMYRLS